MVFDYCKKLFSGQLRFSENFSQFFIVFYHTMAVFVFLHNCPLTRSGGTHLLKACLSLRTFSLLFLCLYFIFGGTYQSVLIILPELHFVLFSTALFPQLLPYLKYFFLYSLFSVLANSFFNFI